jgi:photosystem II stability/assembly factor-like uncharacterized protein
MMRNMPKPLSFVLVCALFLPAAIAQPVPNALFNQLEWRMIGPFRGGRVASVAGVPGDSRTFYFGSVGGGVWKTTNAGTVWSPIFDQQEIASIGAIAVASSNTNVVYVGTGEADIRSQICFGDGVYKSTDAGKTWKNIGLRDTRQIAKILVDPRNPNMVYVAALGHPYGLNQERGVFRSTNGGETWQKVLFTSPEVGAVDLAWDPANTKVIFATMWNGRRPPWSVYAPIEGPGSGLWKSTDGGEHWSQVTGHGLPDAQWRRSGVAVATGGRRVYVVVDAQGGGLFRSDDAGETWTRASADNRITSRNWYFSGITVDPVDPDWLYIPNVAVYRSTDGGKNFTVLKGQPGGDDYHILWIDPIEPTRMILGSDQGTNITVDRGTSWSTWYNQPTAQMYHAITDRRFPYAVMGSQQDSGTAGVMSRTDHGEIDARDWFSVGGAESGYIAVDGKNDNILYVGNTNGALVRYDRRTGQAQNITPSPGRGGGGPNAGISTLKYRYPWTAPIIYSQIDNTLYFGSQYLMKTTDGGLTWKEISGDLTGDTRKDKTAADVAPTLENSKALGYGVVYAIGPSPLKPGLVWVGSDTGLVHITTDGGATWKNITPPGLPDWSKISQIDASHFDPATAYISVDRHRMEDYKPYIYRTRDYGKTWTLIKDGLAEPAFVNCVREDPARKGLLYAGTDLGAMVSFDDGDHWQSLKLNLPAVSVRDLVIHGDDLVAATHGRGFWIMDDIAALRQIDRKAATAEAILYKPATAIRMNPEGFAGTPFPPEEPKAKNPPDGAILDYYFRTAPEGEVTLEILDAKGQPVQRYSTQQAAAGSGGRRGGGGAIADIWIVEPQRFAAKAGMNRFLWDLHYGAADAGESGGGGGGFGGPARGPAVLPGAYQVRLTAAGHSYTQPLTVKLDPRSTATPLDLSKQFELSMNCSKATAQVAAASREAQTLRRLLADRKSSATGDIAAKIAALDGEAAKFAVAAGGGRGGRGGGGNSATAFATISGPLSTALSVAQSADRTPPSVAYTLYNQASRDLAVQLAAWKTIRDVKLAELNRALQQASLPAIELDTAKPVKATTK